ncbi:carboxypeptidase regulatory-like domain-containing protein, partial [Candidatus Micrarchaeota archaeon]|nr:carboxypeptidase regulatory-like domain-containing protein [Candidatus Micrarchaeota archaeon]
DASVSSGSSGYGYGYGWDWGYGGYNYGCYLTAAPASIYAGESATIYVESWSLTSPYGGYIDCGNGLPAGMLGCVYGSCAYSCYYPSSGQYWVMGYSGYGICAPTQVNVGSQYANGPGVIVTTGTTTPTPAPQRTCTDGTPWGFCSSNRPDYCRSGQLIEKASLCGCPDGQSPSGDSCVTATCSDGTEWGHCSSIYHGQLCNEGRLVEDAVRCGCPEGQRRQDGVCVDARPFCAVSTNSPQRAGSSVAVSIEYADFEHAPKSARVSCGNGNDVVAACGGAASWGRCNAVCNYDQRDYPKTYDITSSFSGITQCRGSAEVIPPLATTGTVLAKVTDCASGAAIESASVHVVQNSSTRYTDANGEAQFKNLAPATYTLQASAAGYNPAYVSSSVSAGEISVASMCLRKSTPYCDITAELVSEQSCPAGTTQAFQIKVSNTNGQSKNASVSYSSPYSVSGPSYLVLGPLESRIITGTITHDADLAGATAASVNINSGSCVANVVVPLCLNSGITLSANDEVKSALPGTKACYGFTVRNRGPSETRVQLSATGDFSSSFDIERILLASQESRKFTYCVDVPEEALGQHDFVVRASSASNDANASVRLSVLRTDGISSDFTGCQTLQADNAAIYEAITLSNSGQTGDYHVEVEGAGMPISITQSEIYNFQAGSERTVYATIRPAELGEGRENHATLTVTKDGKMFLQQDLCFRVQGTFDAFVQLARPHVTVQKGQSTAVLLQIHNTGTATDSYAVTVTPPFNSITLNPSELQLHPKEDSLVELLIAPLENTPEGEYVVPIQVYSQDYDPTFDYLIKEELLRVTVTGTPRSDALNFTVNVSDVEFQKTASDLVAAFVISVTNNEIEAANLTLDLADVPEGWTYEIQPAKATLNYSETKNFTAVLHTNGAELADHTVTVSLSNADGRKQSIPVTIPAEKARTALGATGLFTLGNTDNLLLLALVVLVVVAIAVYAKTQELKNELVDYRPGELAKTLRQ